MATKIENKYIAVMYRLYTDGPDGKPVLVEETGEGDPFVFVSSLGMTLDAFEAQIVPLRPGDGFDFFLSPSDAYGDYEEAGKQALPISVFEINGKIDPRYIHRGAIVPLNSADGARFNGIITEVGDQTVTVDLNHPLAGKQLHFVGTVVESREATNGEVSDALKQITGQDDACGGCGGCGSCGGCGGCKG